MNVYCKLEHLVPIIGHTFKKSKYPIGKSRCGHFVAQIIIVGNIMTTILLVQLKKS